jgi:hypothetical protein
LPFWAAPFPHQQTRIPDKRRLNDRRRQPIAHLVHLRRDSGTEIMIKSAEGKVRHPVFNGLREDLRSAVRRRSK